MNQRDYTQFCNEGNVASGHRVSAVHGDGVTHAGESSRHER